MSWTIMSKRTLTVMTAALAFLRVSAAPAQTRQVQSAQAESVAAYLQREMQERGIPGLQVAVVQHGRIVLVGAYGVANVERREPVTSHTLFSIHSATKTFTGVAMMQLVEAGKVDLAAPVSRYLTGLPAAWQAVTIRQLLTHTSGLPDIVDRRTGGLIDSESSAAWAKVQTLPVESAPGERFSYNQTNYLLLGRIIEKVSDLPFTRFIVEHQLAIAGMPFTGGKEFVIAGDSIPHRAQSYQLLAAGLSPVNQPVPQALLPAGGMYSTAKELARWLIALERGHLLQNRTSLVTLWTPSLLQDGSVNRWALGWPAINRAEHRATAGIGGGRVAFYVYPDDDLAVVILTNLQGSSPEAFIDRVAEYYIPGLRAGP